jgi:hypothetical protein
VFQVSPLSPLSSVFASDKVTVFVSSLVKTILFHEKAADTILAPVSPLSPLSPFAQVGPCIPCGPLSHWIH